MSTLKLKKKQFEIKTKQHIFRQIRRQNLQNRMCNAISKLWKFSVQIRSFFLSCNFRHILNFEFLKFKVLLFPIFLLLIFLLEILQFIYVPFKTETTLETDKSITATRQNIPEAFKQGKYFFYFNFESAQNF